MVELSYSKELQEREASKQTNQSEPLTAMINQLDQNGDIVLKNYAIKLYWILAGYFKGYLLLK